MASTEPVRKYSGLTLARVSVPSSGSAVQLFDDARNTQAEEDQGALNQPNLGFRELKNLDAANPIYIGKDATVTSSTGHRIDPGQPFTLAGAGVIYLGPIFAIASGAAVAVSTIEY